ncbi:MAG: hypothetical protein KC933_15165, partial [Myxococcales bacterium]|nr:hypothetical protein [Myxococcales bacterium]
IEPKPVGVPAELLAEQQRLQGELEALEDADDDWDDAREEAYNAIDARLDAIAAEIDGYRQFSDEDKARSVCFVNVGRDGKAEIHRGYVSPQAKAKAEKQQRQEAGDQTAGLSQALVDDLGTHRQQIAKAKLARDPKLAMDVLLYSMASQLLTLGYVPRPIEASFSSVGPDLAGGSEHAETPAGVALLALEVADRPAHRAADRAGHALKGQERHHGAPVLHHEDEHIVADLGHTRHVGGIEVGRGELGAAGPGVAPGGGDAAVCHLASGHHRGAHGRRMPGAEGFAQSFPT